MGAMTAEDFAPIQVAIETVIYLGAVLFVMPITIKAWKWLRSAL